MSGDDDAILVKQCLKGDQRAFETIVDKYQKVVFNVALRMVNNQDDAQDVAQSVFIKAYEKLGSFNARYKLFSWLYKMAVNESLNVLDRRKRTEGLPDELVSNEKSPEDTYHEFEVNRSVEIALMELNLDHRVVIVLRHFHDLSYEDIGRILDVPEKTVKSRLFSARQALKDILSTKVA